jgi:hypothetical protein
MSLLAPQNNQSSFALLHTVGTIFVWNTLSQFHMIVSLFSRLANTSNSSKLAIGTKASTVTVTAIN